MKTFARHCIYFKEVHTIDTLFNLLVKVYSIIYFALVKHIQNVIKKNLIN